MEETWETKASFRLSPSSGWYQGGAQGLSGILPAKRILTRSSGCSARLDRTPPLTPATRFSYRTWRNIVLHADDPGADWPSLVIGSGPADTTASRAAEVGRDAVAATVATDAALKQEPPQALAHFRDRRAHSDARSRETLEQKGHDRVQGASLTSPRRSAKEVVRPPPPSPRPASPTAAAGWGWRTWTGVHRTASSQPVSAKLRSAAGSSLGDLITLREVTWQEVV